MKPENIRFFDTQADFRRWLAANHQIVPFQWVGFYKKGADKQAMTYAEAVEEGLCFGWIDGQTNRVDDLAVTTRFSPRRPGSNWSAVNIAKVEALKAAGRMAPIGLRAFEERREPKPGEYTYETRPSDLPEAYASILRRNDAAWNFYAAQRPGYRKSMSWWVVSAKREDTRLRRLDALIVESEAGRIIGDLNLPKLGAKATDV
ncbi:MAG TPA: YdeI/OmpD-associated family protein [Candidatus Limnocylindrales bacterium]|nr:YdeI/OmpD-associated family protein [Candidatus Limnocylindrales bacterium]